MKLLHLVLLLLPLIGTHTYSDSPSSIPANVDSTYQSLQKISEPSYHKSNYITLPKNKAAIYKNGTFSNPYVDQENKGPFSFLKMKYFGDEEWADYEATKDSVHRHTPNPIIIENKSNHPQVTWIGHSTFLIQVNGLNILTDPIFSQRASPLTFAGPKRVHPPAISLDQLPKIDFVLISHNHYDHLDKSTVESLGNSTKWFVPLKNKPWFIDRGIKPQNITEFNWWDSKSFSNFKLTATPSQHWSGRGMGDKYKTLWTSWILQIGKTTIWFAGDTGYNPTQFKQIGKKFSPVDLALIPIGAYSPRSFMKSMHVNPEEAVEIHKDIGSCQSLSMHWGTFPLTAEPIDEPPQRLVRALFKSKISANRFKTLDIGHTFPIKECLPTLEIYSNLKR